MSTNEGALLIERKRPFQMSDSLDLTIAQIHRKKRWHTFETRSHGIVLRVRNANGSLCEPCCQCFGSVKGEDAAATRLRVEMIGEASLNAHRLIAKGKLCTLGSEDIG